MGRPRNLLLMAVILAIGILSAMSVLYSRVAAPGPALRPTLVYIPPGGGFRSFPENLKKDRVIPSRRLFALAAVATGSYGRLQAGEYEIPAQASILDIVHILRAGRQYQRLFTVPEGLTSLEIVEKLGAEPMLSGALPTPPPEGALLPETYAYTRNDSRGSLLRRMAEARARTVAELWAARAPDLPLATPEQAATLASIVEKETARPEERPHIAAVYLNRLRQNMKLQADPTVAYGVAPGKQLGRPLTRADLDTPTPYNTYMNTGLPPAPIANPGKASLAAVLHPIASDDLYFVANGSGGHSFSATLAQHEANVARWRALTSPAAPPQSPAATPPAAAGRKPAKTPKAKGKR